MTTFTAGQKLLLDREHIVTFEGENSVDGLPCVDFKGSVIAVPQYRLTALHRVRIGENGMAREVNPMGSEPDWTVWTEQQYSELCHKHDEWQELEANLKSLRWFYSNLIEWPEAANPIGNTFYAYLDSDHFVLVKPATDFGK